MPLIGRRRELAAVARLVDRARDGVGGVLVIAGPHGSGKTALADAAAALARSRGLPVERTLVPGAHLIVLDDADRGAWPDVSALTGSGAAVLLTTTGDAGHRPDLRLAPLTEPELAELLPGLSADAVHAVWLAGAGWPGPALELAASLDGLGERDAVVELALTTPSRSEFLILDVALIRLLESAAARPLPGATRARVLARLARELLGDQSAAARRRALADEALALARHTGDSGTIAEVLDARLHALWDPAAAEERLATASEIVERAREAGNATVERRGLFWRFVALAELGDLDAAEAALTAYARAGELDGDAEAGVVTLARQAMLAMIRGRFDLTEALTEEVVVAGHDAGLADTDRLSFTLRGWLAILRGDAGSEATRLQRFARRLPGQFFEATAARTLAESGRDAEALLELDRLLPSVLAGTGPRWIGAVADLALVASHGGDAASVRALYDALVPYRGRLVVWGGANMITGPVDDYLGRLSRRLGEVAGGARHFAQAMEHFDNAVAQEERLGTLPWLAATLKIRGRDGDEERAAKLAARLYPEKSDDSWTSGHEASDAEGSAPAGAEWRLERDGDDWRLAAGPETARLNDVRGLHYLRTLLASPGREIAALDLVAGGAGLNVAPGEPVLDATARASFRQRLDMLESQLDAADRKGDVKAARTLDAERTALVAELRRAGGFGGRPRRQSAEAERARVNATRALQTVLTRLEVAAPLAAAHLRASLHTGNRFRYQPAPGGPARWRV
ncbi:ATP-binding protein [Actinoplanes sp. TBRC 11911]|uniref:ATP-binding protein n=1 Tax=Actinoplanes sp. TBRC 11911 TaxID=2729386 RepID=UPI00145DFF1D|nr:ATP-binding protein [Actinoplanes sp. TBRC 11911]NMO54054.1 ATP-binding protein [Actinoplanes sp. TBRC 11911]